MGYNSSEETNNLTKLLNTVFLYDCLPLIVDISSRFIILHMFLYHLVAGVTKMRIKTQLLLMKMPNEADRMRKQIQEVIVKELWLEAQKLRSLTRVH